MNKCECCGARWNMGDNQWIKVEDRLPKAGERVIASDGDAVGEYYFINGNFETDEGYFIDATHWMPLPEAPNETI